MIHVGNYLGIVMEDATHFQESLPARAIGKTICLQMDMLLASVPNLKTFHITPNGGFSISYAVHVDTDLKYNPVARATSSIVENIEAVDSAIQILVFRYAVVAIAFIPATFEPTTGPRYHIIMRSADGATRSGYAHNFKELLMVYRNLKACRVFLPHASLV